MTDPNLHRPINGAISFRADELLKCGTPERFHELLDFRLAQLRIALFDEYEHWISEGVMQLGSPPTAHP